MNRYEPVRVFVCSCSAIDIAMNAIGWCASYSPTDMNSKRGGTAIALKWAVWVGCERYCPKNPTRSNVFQVALARIGNFGETAAAIVC